MSSSTKTQLVIVGSGWGGSTFLNHLDINKFDVTMISTQQTLSYTPLLASAACGLFDFGVTEEPVRRKSRAKALTFYRAIVSSVDLQRQIVSCRPQFAEVQNNPGGSKATFDIRYDYIVFTHGCTSQTFGIPGVLENSLIIKTTADARTLRTRVIELFEMASLPSTSAERRKELLHFAVVGGGPTGVEVSAELSDLISDDLVHIYPHLAGFPSVTIFDVAPNILAMFEKTLATYARKSFEKRGIRVATETRILEVHPGHLITKESGRIPFGALVWATGNGPVPLTQSLECKKTSHGLLRLLTTKRLELQDHGDKPILSAFALGDASDIQDQSLPTTAEVATQKARYLAARFNKMTISSSLSNDRPSTNDFQFKEVRMVAYLGGWDGIWRRGNQEREGRFAWFAWRGTTLNWTTNWREKILILTFWFLASLYGKEIARK